MCRQPRLAPSEHRREQGWREGSIEESLLYKRQDEIDPASAPVWLEKSSLTIKEMELVTYSLPTRKTLGVDACTGEFYQTFKE